MGLAKMQIEELETQLKNGNLGSLYLLYGEEIFLLESSLKKIKSLFGKTIKRNKLHIN